MTFALVLLFMLLVFWRPQEWLWRWMYGIPFLNIITFGALLSSMLESQSERKYKVDPRHPLIICLVGLWVATMMSHISHTYFQGLINTFGETFKICFFPGLLLIVLDRPKRLRAVGWTFVLMSAVMAFNSLQQVELGYGFAGQLPLRLSRRWSEGIVVRTRFFGLFHDPNDLAQFLVVSMPFAFTLLRRRGFLVFVVGAAAVAYLMLAFLTTDSRGGQVGLVTLIAILVLLRLPRRAQLFLAVSGVLLALALIPLAVGWFDQSARERFMFWGYANRAFKANMAFGVGYRMMGEYIPKSRAVHNAFVLCYAELGVFGYWFWIGMIYHALVGVWRTRAALTGVMDLEARWLRGFCGFALASLISYLASSYFLSRAFQYPLFFLVAMLHAVPGIAEPYLQAADRTVPQNRLAPIPITLLTVGSILYLYVSILLLNKMYGG